MVLSVPFSQFAAEVSRRCENRLAYVSRNGSRSVVTSGDTMRSLVVRAETELSPDEVRSELTSQGLIVHEGEWSTEAVPTELLQGFWFAAVAYQSSEERPGLWVDATFEEPSQGAVLTKLVEEVREEAGAPHLTVEEFIRMADPNVVIVSLDEAKGFAQAARLGEPCD
jgi:hypothetical protein